MTKAANTVNQAFKDESSYVILRTEGTKNLILHAVGGVVICRKAFKQESLIGSIKTPLEGVLIIHQL